MGCWCLLQGSTHVRAAWSVGACCQRQRLRQHAHAGQPVGPGSRRDNKEVRGICRTVFQVPKAAATARVVQLWQLLLQVGSCPAGMPKHAEIALHAVKAGLSC